MSGAVGSTPSFTCSGLPRRNRASNSASETICAAPRRSSASCASALSMAIRERSIELRATVLASAKQRQDVGCHAGDSSGLRQPASLLPLCGRGAACCVWSSVPGRHRMAPARPQRAWQAAAVHGTRTRSTPVSTTFKLGTINFRPPSKENARREVFPLLAKSTWTSLRKSNASSRGAPFCKQSTTGLGALALTSLFNPRLFALEPAMARRCRALCGGCTSRRRRSGSFTCSCPVRRRTSISSIRSRSSSK